MGNEVVCVYEDTSNTQIESLDERGKIYISASCKELALEARILDRGKGIFPSHKS